MKNLILCLVLLFAAFGANAQTATGKTPAQEATEKMAQVYGLTTKQQSQMLEIQERKFRNLAEIEPLKMSDPTTYLQKVRSLQLGQNASFERILNEQQRETMKEQQRQLRDKKAVAYKELKTAGASEQEISQKMIQYDLEAL